MAPTPQEVTRAEEIIGNIQKMAPEFAKVLPSHVPAERFVRVAITALRMRPEIAKADPRMIYGEFLKCAGDGLVPDGREATINCYFSTTKKEHLVKYLPMIGGICKKARNSGEIATIDAQVVYENDTYEAWTDEKGQHFKHVKTRGPAGKVILTYAYAITKDGGFFFEEVDEGQMADIEKVSAAADSGPWSGPFRDEMRRKSALRRLLKYRVPSSSDLDDVIRRDDDPEAFTKKPAELPAGKGQAALPAPAKQTRMDGILAAQTGATEPEKVAAAQPVAAQPAAAAAPVADDQVPI